MTTETTPGGNTADDNSVFEPSKGVLQPRRHELQKRQGIDPVGAAWQIPLFYGACGLGAKIGAPLGGVLSKKLYGPFGKALAPVVVLLLFSFYL